MCHCQARQIYLLESFPMIDSYVLQWLNDCGLTDTVQNVVGSIVAVVIDVLSSFCSKFVCMLLLCKLIFFNVQSKNHNSLEAVNHDGISSLC